MKHYGSQFETSITPIKVVDKYLAIHSDNVIETLSSAQYMHNVKQG